MKATIVITEKRSVSESIVRALAPTDSFDLRGGCNVRHCDVLSIAWRKKTDRYSPDEETVRQKENSDDYSFYQDINEGGFYRVSIEHQDKMGSVSERRILKEQRTIQAYYENELKLPILQVINDQPGINRSQIENKLITGDFPQMDKIDTTKESLKGIIKDLIRKLDRGNDPKIIKKDHGFFLLKSGEEMLEVGLSRPVCEELYYFIFKQEDHLYIFLDTNGNPLKMFRPKNNDRKTYSLRQIERRLFHLPGFQQYGLVDRRSYVARMRLFERVLVDQRMPCDAEGIKENSKLEICKVIAATDEDIAGAAIFLSIIGFVNRSKTFIDDDKIFRVHLPTMDSEGVKIAFENLRAFDWHNAYAGRLREVFDFIYGTELKFYLNPKGVYNGGKRLTTGRTLFLALKKIIETEAQYLTQPPKRYIYLAFNNILGLESIKQALQSRKFTAVQLLIRDKFVSLPTLMDLCREEGIGTHTTRYRLAHRLAREGWVVIRDGQINYTPLGRIVYEWYERYLNSPKLFSISEWNQRLHNTIESMKLMSNSTQKDEIESYYHHFLTEFTTHFSKFLSVLTGKRFKVQDSFISCMDNIITALRLAYNESKKIYLKADIPKNEYRLNTKGNDKFHLESVSDKISNDDIMKMIDSNAESEGFNKPIKDNRITTVERNVPVQMVNLEDEIRKILCLSLDSAFKIEGPALSVTSIHCMNYATVFRAKVTEKNAINSFFEGSLEIEQFTPMPLVMPDLEEDDDEAHESLRLKNVRRSDIVGKQGAKVAQEYNKPWVYTNKINQIAQNGDVPLESLKVHGLEFERVSRYEYGVVHNYESLLCSMLEQYRMSFFQTGRVAESMYLNSDN